MTVSPLSACPPRRRTLTGYGTDRRSGLSIFNVSLYFLESVARKTSIPIPLV